MEMREEEKTYDVVCVGQIVQDIMITDIPKNALTSENNTFKSDTLLFASGGDAVNEAVALSRLGSKTALMTRLDTGNVGNTLYHELEKEPLDLSYIVRKDDCLTLSTIVIIMPDGEHVFLAGPGINYSPELSDIDFSLFARTKAVTAGSLFSLGPLDRGGIANLFQAAKSSGALTVADMNNDVEHIGPRALDCVYPYTDYLMPSLDEAVYVSEKTSPDEIADFFLSRGVGNLVLKLGAEGCFFKNKAERFFMDPFQITPNDTTGCGDNFVAGFLHMLLKGKSHKECARFACGCGALNSQELGGHSAVRSEAHVIEFMEKNSQISIRR
ncbi:PfkB family carbohydrate kinase [Lacrimispora sp. NSJ-141]|uniref:PfkB family carbohydrate kinase n=1 Tax=Lientehia hominis TaxID=2897778 RepID=A0AAP2RLC5_9FIRM|nr:PfkB family carbohydrate kinase [Lientehia hominis]MCD2493215.1 PfkB family carbohydrate kinase [Lientehia hominis]